MLSMANQSHERLMVDCRCDGISAEEAHCHSAEEVCVSVSQQQPKLSYPHDELYGSPISAVKEVEEATAAAEAEMEELHSDLRSEWFCGEARG